MSDGGVPAARVSRAPHVSQTPRWLLNDANSSPGAGSRIAAPRPATRGRLEPSGRGQTGDGAGLVGHGLGSVPVRADLEGVLSLDLEEVADLGQHAGYR